jgi:hypothetical protein
MSDKGNEKKIINRVIKLLRMADDVSSPNEALIAARRARKLMDKHQLTKVDLLSNDNDSFAQQASGYCAKQNYVWLASLATSSATLNDCTPVLVRSSGKVRYVFRGFKADSILASQTHCYLAAACNRALLSSKIKGVAKRNFFKLGFCEEISRRIDAIVAERSEGFCSEGGKSLVTQKKNMVDAHFGSLPNVRHHKPRLPNQEESDAVIMGRESGKSVHLGAVIEN